ncbi:MAG: glycosyltransferase family 4 protein [Paracoccaceae bacterium]
MTGKTTTMGRVLHITDKGLDGGGIAQVIASQMDAARAAGWQAERLRIGNGGPVPLRFTASHRRGAPPAAALRAELAKPFMTPDLVHLHLGFTALSPVLIAEMARIAPLVVSLHDVSPFCPNGTRMRQPGLQQCSATAGLACVSGACAGHGGRIELLRSAAFARARRAVWAALLQHGARLIAPSTYLADQARDAGADSAKLVTLPHGVDLTPPAPLPRPSDCPPDIAYAGRLDLLKGPAQALDMLPHLPQSARLILCGDGPARAMLEHRAAVLGLGDRVQFRGWLDRATLTDTLSQVRCVIQPSLIPEGFGLSIIEAYALARPVAGFGRGATAELLPQAAIAKAPTGAALAAALRGWIDSPGRADADGLAAQARVQDLGAEATAARLMALYHTLCPEICPPYARANQAETDTGTGTGTDTDTRNTSERAGTCSISA